MLGDSNWFKGTFTAQTPPKIRMHDLVEFVVDVLPWAEKGDKGEVTGFMPSVDKMEIGVIVKLKNQSTIWVMPSAFKVVTDQIFTDDFMEATKELYEQVPGIVKEAMDEAVKESEQGASDNSEAEEETQNDGSNDIKYLDKEDEHWHRACERAEMEQSEAQDRADRRDHFNHLKDDVHAEYEDAQKWDSRMQNSRALNNRLLLFIAQELVTGFERLDNPRVVMETLGEEEIKQMIQRAIAYPGPTIGDMKPPASSEMREMSTDEIERREKSVPTADTIEATNLRPELMMLAEAFYRTAQDMITPNNDLRMQFDKGPWKHMTSLQKMHWYKVATHAIEDDEDKLNKAWKELLGK